MAGPLVPLAEVERLSPACIRILGGNPGKFTLQGTNTYLVGTGHRRILIDTGEGRPSWAAALKSTLQQERARVEAVLISHWHHDHTGGVDDVLQLCPDAKVYKNQPVEEDGQHGMVDGQAFAVDGASLTAYHTPGHTSDHTVFVLAEEDAMFTADNVLGQGTAVFEDLTTYLASLERMRPLFKGRAYPGHGPVISDGPAKVVEYLRHRKEREDQVLRTLRSSKGADSSGRPGADADGWTAMELVKVIYRDVPEELHEPACGGVLQILEKLEHEGGVARAPNGERWILKDRSYL